MKRRTFLKAVAGASAMGALRINAEPDVAAIAHDPNRPECHLLPPHNWMNDPNGPIFWKGKYHLFYQLNPHGATWGSMHWGHAVSTDMVHWKHQPIAMAPTPGSADSEGCFSGSAVVLNGKPTFIYTGVQNAPKEQVTIRDGSDKLRETQMIAVAEDDNLLRWKKDEQPVIPLPPPGVQVTGFRDPCPWKEADGWYLGVGSGERGKGGCVLLYRSQDFRHWDYLHKLVEGKPNGKQAANPCDSGEMWECPDFFPLGKRHCLIYSTENKVLWTTGRYDAKAHIYTPERSGVLDHGAAYYAPKSFVAADGRRVLWGWLRETRPEAEYMAAGWAGVMSYPRVLELSDDGALVMTPAKELGRLRAQSSSFTLDADHPVRMKLPSPQSRISVNSQTPWPFSVTLQRAGRRLWHCEVDVAGKVARCDETVIPLKDPCTPSLDVYIDGSVIEAFIGNGSEVITSRIYTLGQANVEAEISYDGSGRMSFELSTLKAISPDRLTS